MLTIENLYKIIAEDFVVSKNGTNEHWVVDDIVEQPELWAYDIKILRKMGIFDTIERTIRIQRNKNELGLYLIMIIQNKKLIDRDHIRATNIQTVEGMLSELATIMELI